MSRKREEKVEGFSSVSRKREAVIQIGTRRIDHPTRRRTQGSGMVKGWEDKQDYGPILDTFT